MKRDVIKGSPRWGLGRASARRLGRGLSLIHISSELATLERFEEDYDPIYERYGGRQIVTVLPNKAYELPVGSLWIDLETLAEAEAMMARRAIKVLEPQQLYGLYQWPQWKATVGEDGAIPVVRVMSD